MQRFVCLVAQPVEYSVKKKNLVKLLRNDANVGTSLV